MKKIINYLFLGGIIIALAGLVLYGIKEQFKIVSLILLILGVLAILAYIVLNIKSILNFFKLRSTKYGGNSILAILLLLGIVVIINYIAFRHSYRFDTTQEKIFSLADQTVKILKGLDREIKSLIFLQEDSPEKMRLEDLMKEYRHYSKKFDYEFIDPDKSPGKAQQYKVEQYGTIVLIAGERFEKITSSQENDITNALIKITKEKQKTICFIEGHNEKDLDSQDRTGLKALKDALEGENYKVGKLFLMREEKVSDTCDIIVIAGPEKEFIETEIDNLNTYLNNGGKLLVMLDPQKASLNPLISKWGIVAKDDIVLDISGVGRLFGADEFMPMAMEYGSSEITRNFRTATIYPFARSLGRNKSEDYKGPIASELVKSHNASRSYSGPLTGQIKLDESNSQKGPHNLAMTVEKDIETPSQTEQENQTEGKPAKKARLAVFGDSDFASNSYFGFSGNKDLILNTINWLAQEEELISIRPKQITDRRISLTKGQVRSLFITLVIIIPVAIIVSGVIVWVKRRKL